MRQTTIQLNRFLWINTSANPHMTERMNENEPNVKTWQFSETVTTIKGQQQHTSSQTHRDCRVEWFRWMFTGPKHFVYWMILLFGRTACDQIMKCYNKKTTVSVSKTMHNDQAFVCLCRWLSGFLVCLACVLERPLSHDQIGCGNHGSHISLSGIVYNKTHKNTHTPHQTRPKEPKQLYSRWIKT